MLRFMLQCHEVAARIMSCFAIGLGLPEDYFVDLMNPKHDDCGTVRLSFWRDRKLSPNDELVPGAQLHESQFTWACWENDSSLYASCGSDCILSKHAVHWSACQTLHKVMGLALDCSSILCGLSFAAMYTTVALSGSAPLDLLLSREAFGLLKTVLSGLMCDSEPITRSRSMLPKPSSSHSPWR